MTEALGREAEFDTTSNPLVALKPLVVIATNGHQARVVLGVDSVTTKQRDAAIKYLNGLIGGDSLDSSFKLDITNTGEPYSLIGVTKLAASSAEFRAVVKEGVQPEFYLVGELTVEIARKTTRHMIGVECTLKLSDRTFQTIPKLDDNPDEVHGLHHEGGMVSFSLKDVSHKEDAELIGAAMRVAKAFGVYVENPPTKVGDKDPKARMYPEFDYVDRSDAA